MAISERIDAEKVAAGLIMWSIRQDGNVRAAVDLLIHTGWYRIPEFRKVLLDPESQGRWYVVRWSHARRAFDNDEFTGLAGDRAEEILDFAIALGENRYGLNLQNDTDAGAMIRALAKALGAMHVDYEF